MRQACAGSAASKDQNPRSRQATRVLIPKSCAFEDRGATVGKNLHCEETFEKLRRRVPFSPNKLSHSTPTHWEILRVSRKRCVAHQAFGLERALSVRLVEHRQTLCSDITHQTHAKGQPMLLCCESLVTGRGSLEYGDLAHSNYQGKCQRPPCQHMRFQSCHQQKKKSPRNRSWKHFRSLG